MAIGTQKTSNQRNVRYEVDVRNIFNQAFVGEDPAKKSLLRQRLSDPDIMYAIGEKIIETIVDRTQSGYDKESSKFQKYSERYRKSFVFKVYKGSQRKVDLTLTGDMLSSMIHQSTGSKVIIKFTDALQSQKTHGHITGGGYLPKRDYLGITAEEGVAILRDVYKTVGTAIENIDISTDIEQAITVSNEGTEITFEFEDLDI